MKTAASAPRSASARGAARASRGTSAAGTPIVRPEAARAAARPPAWPRARRRRPRARRSPPWRRRGSSRSGLLPASPAARLTDHVAVDRRQGHAVRGVPVGVEQAPRRALPREGRGPLASGAGAPAARSSAPSVGRRRDRGGPRAGVVGRQVGRRVPADLAQRRRVGGEHGHPRRHRLQHRQAEALLARGHQHRGRARARSAARRPAESIPSQRTRSPAPARAARPRSRRSRRGRPGAGHHEPDPGGGARDRLDGDRGVLVRLDRARVEHVGALGRRRPAGRPARGRPRGPPAPAPASTRARRATSAAVSAEGVSTSRARRQAAQVAPVGEGLAGAAGAGEVLVGEAGRDQVVAGHDRAPRRHQRGLDGVEHAVAGQPARGALADGRGPRDRAAGAAASAARRPRGRRSRRAPPGRGAPAAPGARLGRRAPPGPRSPRGRRCRCPAPSARPRAASRRAGPGRASGAKAYSAPRSLARVPASSHASHAMSLRARPRRQRPRGVRVDRPRHRRASSGLRRARRRPDGGDGRGGGYGALWRPRDEERGPPADPQRRRPRGLRARRPRGRRAHRALIDADAVVLDLGCGIGRVARYVAPMCRTLWAVNASEVMLGHARRRLAGTRQRPVRPLRGDRACRPSPTTPSTSPTRSSRCSTSSARTPSPCCATSARIVRPGGRAYLTFPNLLSDTYLARFIAHVDARRGRQPGPRPRLHAPGGRAPAAGRRLRGRAPGRRRRDRRRLRDAPA